MNIITAQNFRLVSCQASLFTPDEAISSAKLVQGLLPRWGELFDGEPTILPPSDTLPPQVPRLILESKSQAWRCQIASARIDLFWQKTVADPSDIPLDAFFREAIQRLNEYQAFLSARVGRMAAVLNRYAEHPKPGLFIAQYFCQDRWLSGPLAQVENCEFHAHQHMMLAEQYRVNYWVRNKTGSIASGQDRRAAVLLEQDVNTLTEDLQTQTFTSEHVQAFFFATAMHFDESLQRYYPAEGHR